VRQIGKNDGGSPTPSRGTLCRCRTTWATCWSAGPSSTWADTSTRRVRLNKKHSPKLADDLPADSQVEWSPTKDSNYTYLVVHGARRPSYRVHYSDAITSYAKQWCNQLMLNAYQARIFFRCLPCEEAEDPDQAADCRYEGSISEDLLAKAVMSMFDGELVHVDPGY